MKKLFVVGLLGLMGLMGNMLHAQTDWKKVERLLNEGSYKSAYGEAEKVFKRTKNSDDLLASVWYMNKAAKEYQEDAYDSAEARFRAILPRLDVPERALCYAMLGVEDSALMDEELLKGIPSKDYRRYCMPSDEEGLVVSTTLYDVVVMSVIFNQYLRDNHYLGAEEWIQKLIDFHKKDSDEIRIVLDLMTLDWQRTRPNSTVTIAEETYKYYINKYRASKCARKTQFYTHLANHYWYKMKRPEEALRYCDTAIALAPKSSGGADASNLRNKILQTEISLNSWPMNDVAIPGRPSLHRLEYRNIGHLYFGIAPYEPIYEEAFRPRVFRHWEMDVDSSKYFSRSILFDVPALEAGRWLLVVSADGVFDKNDAMLEIACTDMQVMRIGGHTLQLLNVVNGEPIVGQKVEILKREDGKQAFSTQTDRDGRVKFDQTNRTFWVKIVRDGYEFLETCYFYNVGHTAEKDKHLSLVVDRPIYRPGDTVHVAAILYESDELDGRVLPDKKVQFALADPNDSERDTSQTVSDASGVATATFVIPKEGLAGSWNVTASFDGVEEDIWIEVEEYKQPKFMVKLSSQPQQAAPVFGQPYTVRGLAQSYSGANLGGAKVKYRVNRGSYFWRWAGRTSDSDILEDSTVTANDGTFSITFTPMPDSSVELSHKPNFLYHIVAEVTDLNGETHDATFDFRVGYQNTYLVLNTLPSGVSSLGEVSFTLCDINSQPLAGDVKVTVDRLHLPDTARLLPPVMNGSVSSDQVLSRERFREFFPTYAYSKEELDSHRWKTDWTWNVTHHADGTKSKEKVQLPSLKSGYYRVVASCGDEADTQYVTLTLPDERFVQSPELVWADIAGGQLADVSTGNPWLQYSQFYPEMLMAQPGDRLTLRYASAFDDVRFLYILAGPDGVMRECSWLPAGRGIKSLSILVDSLMLGDFTVTLYAVKDGVAKRWSKRVDVPFLHKQMKVDITSFRDKLQPGEQEEWAIKVTNPSTIIMSMYDDALPEYYYYDCFTLAGSMIYGQWRQGPSFNLYNFSPNSATRSYSSYSGVAQGSDPAVSFWVVEPLKNYANYWRRNRFYKELNVKLDKSLDRITMQGGVRKRTSTARGEGGMVEMEESVIEIGAPENGARITAEDVVHMPGNSVDGIVAPVAGMGYSDGFEEEEVLASGGLRKPVQVRSNLSTLAFFVSDLRTNATGTATYRFRVPELLTRWRVAGMAFTNDLKVGLLDRTIVTQKSLMVQPNIPRFLRLGDSIVLMAKVMNLTDNERKVRVNFSLKDASQNIPNELIIQNTQLVAVPAQGSAQVTFPISNLPKELYVATYEITAQTCDEREHIDLPYLSDGERGQIPVVSDRQAVTLSQPVYINGKGEKTFHFPLSTFHSSTTAEPHLLGAELVSNPVWLAIKSMPYLKQQENPSTIYLANSLYVNTLARNIIETIGSITSIESISDTANTRLKINEDVKQTLLEATPWLRDAEAEVEQRQAIANYFDSARLSEEFSKLNAQLASRQNSDGGWSWMPEGESSTWVTMQVLKRLSILKQSNNQAIKQSLSYVDREEQRHYEKYIKPYLKKYKWEPDNIDYLYTRSYYGKGTTEAYKFYYKNALKNYRKYNGLYTQAQLALIFQRHGDKKAARDLIRRLKEKCLVNDEMGMYWRDNRSGWCWYERPIETQALLIQAFREVTPQDTASIALMQQWLLKQKQTSHWGNDRATVEAISALVMASTNVTSTASPTSLEALKSTTMTLCGIDLSAPSEGLEGYRSQRWEGPALDSIIALGDSTITLRKNTSGIAWGSVYFQYTDDMDKIPSSESGITISRRYELRGQTIQPPTSDLQPPTSLKVGDRIKVRIDISCDRTMEYLELIDGRPSCVEPLSTRAGWCWNDGLRYYVDVKNTATHCYINRLEKGKYVVEYEVYVTNPGTFLAGPVTMQCMYAPEFRAIAPAQRLTVK